MIKEICVKIMEKPVLVLAYIVGFMLLGLIFSDAASKCRSAYWIGHDHTKDSNRFALAAGVSYMACICLICCMLGVYLGGPAFAMLRSPPEKREYSRTFNYSNTIANALIESTNELEHISNDLIKQINYIE